MHTTNEGFSKCVDQLDHIQSKLPQEALSFVTDAAITSFQWIWLRADANSKNLMIAIANAGCAITPQCRTPPQLDSFVLCSRQNSSISLPEDHETATTHVPAGHDAFHSTFCPWRVCLLGWLDNQLPIWLELAFIGSTGGGCGARAKRALYTRVSVLLQICLTILKTTSCSSFQP